MGYNDSEYLGIVCDILNNDDFQKIANSSHHGGSRMTHCLRVSYYSYVWAKKLKLNYQEVARAGLLHDFFTNEELNSREYKVYAFIHHAKALKNATQRFSLSAMEKDIIMAHMFPMVPYHVPRYLESWLVSLVDKAVATYDYYESFSPVLKEKLANYGWLMAMFISNFNKF